MRGRCARDRHIIWSERVWIHSRRSGNAGGVDAGPLQQRIHGQQAAIAAPPDADAIAVDVGHCFETIDHRLQIVEVLAAVVHQERLAELAAVAHTAAHIHLDDDVALLNEELLERTGESVPAVAHGIGVDRAEDHGMAARAIEGRRLEDARMHDKAVQGVREGRVAWTRPLVPRKVRQG